MTQSCGGYGGYISLYYDSLQYFPANNTFAAGSAPPGPPPSIGSCIYAGCYNDSVAARTLSSTNVGNAKTNSLENCATSCQGYNYFGAEYGSEFYCGNSSETCAAGSRLNLYVNSGTQGSTPSSFLFSSAPSSTSSTASSTTTTSIASRPDIPETVGSYSYVECHSDNTTLRTLRDKSISTTDIKIEYCMGNCTGYQYFGVEYGVECYCGNNLTFGSYQATDGRCIMLCGGNNNEICGGRAGQTLYVLSYSAGSSSSGAASSSADVSTGISGSISTMTTVATVSTEPMIPSDISSKTSIPVSSSICSSILGLSSIDPLAGLEHSKQCFCALSLSYNSQPQPESSCSWPCKGDSIEICVGSRRLSVYNDTSYVYPEIVQSVGTYSVQECYVDPVAARC
ncbi:WSC domain containing protein [Hyaloscypha variabilis]